MNPIPAQRKPLRGDSQKKALTNPRFIAIIFMFFGPVAQLGERSVRIREVESSSLFRSTIVVVNCTGSRRLFYWQLHLCGYMARSKDAGIKFLRLFCMY